MNKKILSLALTALLTITQFNVVKASTKEDASQKASSNEVITKGTNELKTNEEIVNKPTENAKILEKRDINKEPIKETSTEKKEVVKEAVKSEALTVKQEDSQQRATVQEALEQELKIGQTVNGNLNDTIESITYKVQVPNSGALSVSYNGYIDSSSIEIIDENGLTIDSDSVYRSGSSGIWNTSKDVLPGTYYITVSSWYSGYFYLTVNHKSANTNETEPNNDINTAQKVEPNAKDINGFISLNDNADVYKIQVSKNGLLTFGLKSNINNVNFELSDEQGNILFYTEVEKYYEEDVAELMHLQGLKPGTYYIKFNKVGTATGSYTLKIKSYDKDGWIKLDNGNYTYYEAAKNSLKTGWLQYQGAWYYLDNEGIMQTELSVIKGQYYYFNKSGAMQTGWVNAYGTWYYFTAGGAAKEGWLKQGSSWYYINFDGEMAKKLNYIKNVPYYFGNDGVMKTGWIKENNKWYYFDASGAGKVSKWFKSGSNWYYFDSYGQMATGNWKIDNRIFYFGSDGAMKTGWQRIDGRWYYFNEGGDRHHGWKLLGGKWYYMHSTYGHMVTGAWYIDGEWYFFDSNGVLQ